MKATALHDRVVRIVEVLQVASVYRMTVAACGANLSRYNRRFDQQIAAAPQRLPSIAQRRSGFARALLRRDVRPQFVRRAEFSLGRISKLQVEHAEAVRVA